MMSCTSCTHTDTPLHVDRTHVLVHDRCVSATNPESEYEALVHLMRRVSARFPETDEDVILVLTAEELERFGGARLRDYVPVLVEHNVVRRLRAQSRDAA